MKSVDIELAPQWVLHETLAEELPFAYVAAHYTLVVGDDSRKLLASKSQKRLKSLDPGRESRHE